MFRRSFLLVLVSLFLTAGPASADEFFAGPDSTRTTAPCVRADPCQINSTFTLATIGDTVILLPGDYFQPGGTTPWPVLPDIGPGVDVRGDDPADPPVIHGLTIAIATPFMSVGTGASLQDTRVEMAPSPGLTISYALDGRPGASINRVRVHAVNPGAPFLIGCTLASVTIRNSVCLTTGPGSSRALVASSTGSDYTTNIINTTAISTGTSGHGIRVGISSAHTSTMNIRNSIARGPTADLGTGTFTGTPAMGTAIINIDHSNWNTYDATGTGVTNKQLNVGAGNQTGPTAAIPVFVDEAAGDYRQAVGSPTIDAGSRAIAPDPITLGGTPRVFGAAPDIGAYEYVPPDIPGPGGPGGPGPADSLTFTGLKVKKKWSLRKGTTVRFKLSRAADVRFVFDRRKGKRRFVRVGVKLVKGQAGNNRFRLKRKLPGGKRLRPGQYRLKAVATASDGTRSIPRNARFRIRR